MKEYFSIRNLASRWNSKNLSKSDKIKEGRMSKSRLQLVVYDIWHRGGGFCQSWHLSSLFNKVLVWKYPKYQYLNCFSGLWFRSRRKRLDHLYTLCKKVGLHQHLKLSVTWRLVLNETSWLEILKIKNKHVTII